MQVFTLANRDELAGFLDSIRVAISGSETRANIEVPGKGGIPKIHQLDVDRVKCRARIRISAGSEWGCWFPFGFFPILAAASSGREIPEPGHSWPDIAKNGGWLDGEMGG